MKSSNILIFIPTYNEADNVERLCRELNQLQLGADILVCDDNSPDGTGQISIDWRMSSRMSVPCIGLANWASAVRIGTGSTSLTKRATRSSYDGL